MALFARHCRKKATGSPRQKSSTDIPGACGAPARIPDRHPAGIDRIVSGFGKGSVSVCGSAREPAGSHRVCGRRVPAVPDGVGPRREARRAKSDGAVAARISASLERRAG
jgi:hypothetical protein